MDRPVARPDPTTKPRAGACRRRSGTAPPSRPPSRPPARPTARPGATAEARPTARPGATTEPLTRVGAPRHHRPRHHRPRHHRPRHLWHGLWTGLALGLCLAAALPAQAASEADDASEVGEAPEVVVSILPLHGLVAAVMAGAGRPHLLVRGGASPHDASLRPSDARALSAARLVVWAGPGLETFLVGPLGVLAARARILTLTEAPGMILLEQREGGVFETESGGDHGHDAHDGHGAGAESINPHLWLDPRNAVEIARQVAAALAQLDPGKAPRYGANAARLIARLEALDRELEARLEPLAGIPFAVFHDAYPYFEARYGLRALGALTVNPALPPGAQRLAALRARLRHSGAACVFAEPQFRPAMVAALVEGSGARAAILDPLGAGLTPGPEAYFVVMRELADGLAGCLTGGG